MKKVVFDIDDTSWGLNERVCSLLGIDINDITDFYIKNNSKLTSEQKQQLIVNYSDESIFENIVWYDGFTDIFELESLGCEVYINSNCNTVGVKNAKYQQLIEDLQFPVNRVILNIVSDPKDKVLDDDIFILVDDSPFNIAKSTAKYNIALTKPWNTSESGLEIIGDKKVIYCNSFIDIIDTVRELLTA